MRCKVLLISLLFHSLLVSLNAQDEFLGKHYHGTGDTGYLELLEKARRFFDPDPVLPNISMLYSSTLNSLVEGPTWDAWWIQNSYGTTYCALPFYQEPYLTFLQNAQDFWFDQMGDGKRIGANGWQAPDGCLCDCARPGWIMYKQGDGKINIHDWGIGFTAAGLLMQSELLLISRDRKAIDHYLPMLERSANFIDSRRDPANNLYLAGPAGNLLAPSYAGWLKPDGTYGQAYLAELSVTFIAALDRLIEVEKLAGRTIKVKDYSRIRDLARKGLPKLLTTEDYFMRSIDPDGTFHGVYGASKHGYFEASPNHDAIAFRVTDDKQSAAIFKKIESIPGLRPYKLVIPNYPAYDDMYERETGIWKFGTWVNGGHWSTCEGRMMMAYSRLGKFDDMRQSMIRILSFADDFRMDNPLTKFGSEVYQPAQAYNVTYDAFAIPAAMLRGLFEYLYKSDRLILYPHVPEGISMIEQLDPVRFGSKKIWLSAAGTGEISEVLVNGKKWPSFTKTSVTLRYDQLPEKATITVLFGHSKTATTSVSQSEPETVVSRQFLEAASDTSAGFADLKMRILKIFDQYKQMQIKGLAPTFKASQMRLAFESFAAVFQRREMLKEGKIQPLPGLSAAAVDRLYLKTAETISNGIVNTVN
ncbi:MAG: hypothetical protein WCW62_04885, partial [Bacteroidales bacterium]